MKSITMACIDKEEIEQALNERRRICRQVSLPTEEFRQMRNQMYAEWIQNDNYERDMVTLGYAAHIEVAELISQYIPNKSSRLLDCASGTGLVGQELKARGFLVLDALDASKESLDYSRRKEVYSKYICEELGKNRLPVEDESYDGVCIVASFGKSHIGPNCFPELIRITKSGGWIIFTVREDDILSDEVFGHGKLDEEIHNLAASGRWQYLEKRRIPYMQNKLQGKTEYSYIFVIRVV